MWGVIRVLGLCLDIEWSERLVADITEDALDLTGSSHEYLNAVTSAIGSHIAFPLCHMECNYSSNALEAGGE